VRGLGTGAQIKIALWHLDATVSKPNWASLFWRKLKDHRQNRGLGGAEMVKPREHPVLDLLFLLYQDKRKILKQRFFLLLFYRKKVAKSSVKGLSMGTPLLKNDRFGDPSASLR
jgi:hypothetical protein